VFNKNKFSLIGHLGLCIIALYVGAYTPIIFTQIIISVVITGLYLIIGFTIPNYGTRLKNLFSVILIPLIGLILSLYTIIVYQIEIVNRLHYAHETVHYAIVRTITFVFEASVVPMTNLVGNFYGPFKLPYGLVFTFLYPAVILWIGMEIRRRREASRRKEEESILS
jgi:ABC-type multidrug transport system fused ATPase/permease subunit